MSHRVVRIPVYTFLVTLCLMFPLGLFWTTMSVMFVLADYLAWWGLNGMVVPNPYAVPQRRRGNKGDENPTDDQGEEP